MTPDLCILCAQLSHGLKCTLHGGHMTATEVKLRGRYEVSNGEWVERVPQMVDPYVRASTNDALILSDDELATRSQALADLAKPLFAGQHPGVVSAALADLTSIWLAGHQVDEATHDILLAQHVELIRQLLPISKEEIAARFAARPTSPPDTGK